MLIFGGDSTKSFTFDMREVSSIGNLATVKTSAAAMPKAAKFGV
jgi:hypothetical protein